MILSWLRCGSFNYKNPSIRKKHKTARTAIGPYDSENRGRFSQFIRFLFFGEVSANTDQNFNEKEKKENKEEAAEEEEVNEGEEESTNEELNPHSRQLSSRCRSPKRTPSSCSSLLLLCFVLSSRWLTSLLLFFFLLSFVLILSFMNWSTRLALEMTKDSGKWMVGVESVRLSFQFWIPLHVITISCYQHILDPFLFLFLFSLSFILYL